MNKRNFYKLLENQWSRDNFVCVGLDSEFDKIPKMIYQSSNEFNVNIC